MAYNTFSIVLLRFLIMMIFAFTCVYFPVKFIYSDVIFLYHRELSMTSGSSFIKGICCWSTIGTAQAKYSYVTTGVYLKRLKDIMLASLLHSFFSLNYGTLNDPFNGQVTYKEKLTTC